MEEAYVEPKLNWKGKSTEGTKFAGRSTTDPAAIWGGSTRLGHDPDAPESEMCGDSKCPGFLDRCANWGDKKNDDFADSSRLVLHAEVNDCGWIKFAEREREKHSSGKSFNYLPSLISRNRVLVQQIALWHSRVLVQSITLRRYRWSRKQIKSNACTARWHIWKSLKLCKRKPFCKSFHVVYQTLVFNQCGIETSSSKPPLSLKNKQLHNDWNDH